MGLKNWMLNRKLKKDREQNPHLYANLENYHIKYGEIDFSEVNTENDSARLDRSISRLERKIERYR